MKTTKDDILKGLQSLGLQKGSLCMVHSSFKSLGSVDGGINTLYLALSEYLSDSGTIMVPTLSGTRDDGKKHNPFFDVRHTPGWTGLFSETIRKKDHAVRSIHPTHSVAVLGKAANTLTKDHHLSDTPCDQFSPYIKLVEHGGYILLIGVDLDALTLVHACEESINVPYHLHKRDTICTVVDNHGQHQNMAYRLHNWDKPKTDYNKVFDDLLTLKILVTTQIGQAMVHLISARRFYSYVTHLLHMNPYYFIEK